MKTYSDKLKDPRWQKKRLEIMERDGFQCQTCSDTDKTLNVHHKFYMKNTEPWEYPDTLLITLCDDCHDLEHELEPLHNTFAKHLLSHGYTNHLINVLLDQILKLDDPTNAILYLNRKDPFYS